MAGRVGRVRHRVDVLFRGFGVAGLRRRPTAVPVLAATAALLCCDAWFDVLLGWGGPGQWTGLALAVLVESPLAMFLLAQAKTLLISNQP